MKTKQSPRYMYTRIYIGVFFDKKMKHLVTAGAHTKRALRVTWRAVEKFNRTYLLSAKYSCTNIRRHQEYRMYRYRTHSVDKRAHRSRTRHFIPKIVFSARLRNVQFHSRDVCAYVPERNCENFLIHRVCVWCRPPSAAKSSMLSPRPRSGPRSPICVISIKAFVISARVRPK